MIKRAILRLRSHNSLGELFTDIGTEESTAQALVAAGCDSWESTAPYQRGADTLYVEVFSLPYVQELGNQRDAARAEARAARQEATQTVELAEKLEAEVLELKAQLASKAAVLAATRGDLAKAQRKPR